MELRTNPRRTNPQGTNPRAVTAAVQVRGLVKHYGETKALDGVDLGVAEGTVMAVLGQETEPVRERSGTAPGPRTLIPRGGRPRAGLGVHGGGTASSARTSPARPPLFCCSRPEPRHP
jgi:hypothetical protein